MSEEQPPTQPPAEEAAPAPAPAPEPTPDAAPAPAAAAASESGSSSASALATVQEIASPQALHHHLHKAKALSERLLAVMAQREERLAEIKRRVSLLEQGGGENLQPLIEAEGNMRDAHIRMKAVLGDLGKELQVAGVTSVPEGSVQLADLPSHAGQGDEVAFLYKHLLLALGEWKAAQQKLATERAENLAKQVQNLREQVAREHAETQRIRQRKEELERLRVEKQDELEAIKRDDFKGPGANGPTE